MNQPTAPQSSSASSYYPATGPMTFGQVIDRTYRLMRTHFPLFFGIADVPCAAIFLFAAAILDTVIRMFTTQMARGSMAAPEVSSWFIILFLIAEPILILVLVFYLPAAIYASTRADLGITVTVREAYHTALSRFFRYLWLMILCFLYVAVPACVLAALIGAGILALRHIAGTAASPAGAYFLIPLLVLLYLCLLVYSIYILLRLALACPASVAENLPAWKSIKRSAQLTRGAKGRILLVMLVVYAVTYGVELVGMMVLSAVAALGALGAMMAHVTVGSPAFFTLVSLGVFGYLLVIVATTLFGYAAFTTALGVLYLDQRLRKDSTQ